MLRIHSELQPDRWAWTKTTNGEFSIKSAYWSGRSLGGHEVSNQLYGSIWKMQLHERLKMLLCRISSNVLPTKDRIGRFSNDHQGSCPLCEKENESAIHLFR